MRKNSKIIRIHNSRANNNNNNNNHTNNKINSLFIDDLDLKILGLLSTGSDNKLISTKMMVPLSTIQRRTRKLFQKELINSKFELNYNRLGLKRGLIHIYLSNGCIDKIGQQVANKKGITCVSVHVGNSDLVCTYVCQSSDDLVRILSEVRSIDGVNRVVWSEEVYTISSTSKNNHVLSFKY